MRGTRAIAILAAALAAAVTVAAGAAADGGVARAWGVELTLPDGWARVQPAQEPSGTDPRTVLVIGTDGVRSVESDCQVSAYRVPADGAAVVVIGWREAGGASTFLPLSSLKLRRGTFSCFDGRGAVAQVRRRGLDYQVNVMVGDRADADTVAAALDAARSISAAPRRHD